MARKIHFRGYDIFSAEKMKSVLKYKHIKGCDDKHSKAKIEIAKQWKRTSAATKKSYQQLADLLNAARSRDPDGHPLIIDENKETYWAAVQRYGKAAVDALGAAVAAIAIQRVAVVTADYGVRVAVRIAQMLGLF